MATLIHLHGVDVIYGAGDRSVHALAGVDLRVDAGERVALLGPSAPARPRWCG